MRRADVEDGNRPRATAAETADFREARKRIRIPDQENETLSRAAIYLGYSTRP